MNIKKLVVLGSINADHIISVPYFVQAGETLTGNNYRTAYGGKGANQAVAAARLDANVTFIGCIGSDDIGKAMKTAFSQDGINVQYIQTIENQMTGIAMIQVTESGENSIVIAPGANAFLNEALVEKSAEVIKTADYLLMQLETPIPAVIFAAKYAKSHQTKVVLNPAPARLLPDELLSQVDIITPNETEAELLTGVKVIDRQTAHQSAMVFHQKGVEIVLITLGAKGIYISQQGQGNMLEGFCVEAVDTTAAGDTFNGALIASLLKGSPLEVAIHFAQAAAALSVTKRGAQSSIPYYQDVLAFLAKKVK